MTIQMYDFKYFHIGVDSLFYVTAAQDSSIRALQQHRMVL